MIQISDKFYDKTFKLQSAKHLESLCKSCGIIVDLNHFLNSELVDDGGTVYHADMIFDDDGGYTVILEFQSSDVSEDDVDRFMKYAVLTHLRERKDVHFYVISTSEEENRTITREWNFGAPFTIYVKSLKAIDGDKTLNRIKEKNKNNELTDEDITDLELIIFMKSEKSVVELLWEISDFVNEIQNIDEKEIYDLKMFLYMYVRKFVKDEGEVEKLMERISMKGDLFDRTAKTVENIGFKKGEAVGVKKGEARGIKKGEVGIIRKFLDNGFTVDEFCALGNLDKDYVMSLLN